MEKQSVKSGSDTKIRESDNVISAHTRQPIGRQYNYYHELFGTVLNDSCIGETY